MLVTSPLTDARTVEDQVQAFLARHPGGGSVRLEDPFCGLELTSLGFSREAPLPVMARPPSPPPPVPAPPSQPLGGQVPVRQVVDPASVEVAEKVIVEGFPLPVLQPWHPQVLLPRTPGAGLVVYLAGAEPQGAVTSWSDGRSLGVYWLVVLPAHRSLGLGRALLAAALGRAGELTTTLVATPAGEALYRSVGFDVVAHACRWTRTVRRW